MLCGTGAAAAIAVILALCLSYEAECQARPVRFFVSPQGQDSWSGRLATPNASGTDGPFATLTRARDAIRQLKDGGELQQSVSVLIRRGTYLLEKPLSLGPADSGTESCPIRYTAYPGERPVLCGARRITDWQPYQGQIMQCALPEVKAGQWRFRQLFFNGQRQRRASWPNPQPGDPLYSGWAFVQEALPKGAERPSAFRYEADAAPHHWAKPEQAEVFIFPSYCWVSDLIPVTEVDHAGRIIKLQRAAQPPWMPLEAGNRFRVENVLEELDQPGEWCLDTETGTLYFWPPDGSVAKGVVTAPVTDRLIELIGTADKPVHHIQISGLILIQTLSPFPEQRHNNFHAPVRRGEAVRLENAQYCDITHNLIENVGGDGIRLQDACAYNKVTDNEIAGAGSQGISLASTGTGGNTHTWQEPERLRREAAQKPRSVHNLISNNHIHHSGRLEKHGAGILVWGINSVNNVISHNLIHDIPRHGISAQDGFGRVIIEYNEIHNVCLEMADCGGIETNRWFVVEDDPELGLGNIIRYNLIRDVIGCGAYSEPREGKSTGATRAGGRIWVPYYTWAIYMDNSPINVTVYGNICVGNVLGGISMPVNDPENNLVENNIFMGSFWQQMDMRIGGHGRGNRFVRNIVCANAPGAALLATNNGHGVAECDYNLYYSQDGSLIVRGAPDDSYTQWQQMGFDTHSVVADPLFVDANSGDYRLKPDSPALSLGFVPIPIDQIGLSSK